MALLIALSVGSGNLGRVPGGIAETTGVSTGGCNSWRICNVSKSPGACGDASNKPIAFEIRPSFASF